MIHGLAMVEADDSVMLLPARITDKALT